MEDKNPIRVSASRGRGGVVPMIYLRDRAPESYGKPVRICAQVNRNLDDMSFRGAHADRYFHQVIELGSSQVTNTITSVQKDNIVWIEVFPD
jgi:hypothetical protein